MLLLLPVNGEEPVNEETNFDLQHIKFTMIKNKTNKFDIRNMYSIFSSSLNFSSTNKNISLPGLRPSTFNGKYLKEKITYHRFVFQNSHFFSIHSNKQSVTIYEITIESFEEKLKKKNLHQGKAENFEEDLKKFQFNKKSTENLNVIFKVDSFRQCNDFSILGKYLLLICQNLEKIPKKSLERSFPYELYLYNYQTGEIEMEEKFFHRFIRLPRLLMLTEMKQNVISEIKVLVYDDENNNMSEMDTEKYMFIVSLELDKVWKLGEVIEIDLQGVISKNKKQRLKMKLTGVYHSFNNPMNQYITLVVKHIKNKLLETRVY